MSALFEPLTLRSLTIPNRVWMAPMCQYSASPEGADTGVPGDWHFQHLASRAAGGAGLILVEATAVLPEGRISTHDLGLWNERQQQGFARITAFLEQHGTVPGIQLAHAGRKAGDGQPWTTDGVLAPEDGGWQAVAPSAVAFGDRPVPHELDTDEIQRIVQAFADAARRALAAGFKVVEVHGAHGYLVHSFLSPYANHRTDSYGGTPQNRMRFALEVVEAVRAVWPDELPLFFRTSATDWLSGDTDDQREGWTGEDTVLLAKELQARGVDLLDVSTGGIAPDARIPVAPGFQVPFAETVRSLTGLPTGAVGLITEPEQAQEIVASGRADAVLLGRELLRNPTWPQQAAHRLGATVPRPEQYARAH
ncbi:NADH:flavin oxidoreductase/NADH oxidase [Peterkaempfera bronchialis]|uniref:NADH:flavin oxidoreductase/NADH oxidase n=1 Tax=Peterkaempfera bronchialis TaxID=2126346 RepID=A0A345SXX8_9ACTN|nr:NADH:flavin oxidoreductase/NADH oxidase [Peterkaempfera bronchialis]AXI78583.1 NADH:flavin oxidoreductase/NADH oxidase [Peterkaempfera bronchialis]